ncbi:HSP20-like chaperone, partial [Flagelloscypha sp. PMI_526]
ILQEFRPLFRMLEEPQARQPAFYSARSPQRVGNHFLDDTGILHRLEPAVDVKESGNTYIVEADLPGVKKKDVDVHVGEGGRSLIIRGSVTRSFGDSSPSTGENVAATPAPTEGAEKEPKHVTLSSERSFVENATFTRTILFPQAVDANRMKARLQDGVLTVHAEKL